MCRTPTRATVKEADMNDWHTLLAGIVGSTAYGLAGPDSDIDRLAVAAAPTLDLCGLYKPQETIVTTHPDTTAHEVGKFARLALQCNPTVLELMWLPEYEETSDLGQHLINIRTAFLSAPRVRSAYLGYASQQFDRLKNRGDGSFSSDTRNRTAKHARHLARLCDQGYGLYAYGRLNIRLDTPQYYLDFGERVAAGDLAAAQAMIDVTETNFNETTPALPDQPDEGAVQDWLRSVRTEHFHPTEN